MDSIKAGDSKLLDLGKINVILGKNGCGKSFLLKNADSEVRSQAGVGQVRYLSPERGGQVEYDAGADQQIGRDPNWLPGLRRQNQTPSFRSQSGALFRRLELLVLRGIERDHTKPGYVAKTFNTKVEQLNQLLERVLLKRDPNRVFSLEVRSSGQPTQPVDLSSGEAELISLGIEFLAFAEEAEEGKHNYLFVDEPDVHLHPDLQDRLAKFAIATLDQKPVTLVMATHSTALLQALSAADARVAFMRRGDKNLKFKKVTEVDRAVLPIFGAHPLSNVFNEAPILLIEGEDDERVWQQAVRSSNGRIRLYPCDVGGLANFHEYETEVNNIIEAVYDEARAYSLRDRDLQPESIDNTGRIVRMRLSCRAAENLMLCNEVLASANADWPSLQKRILAWIEANSAHQYQPSVVAFAEGRFDRKGHDLKEIRNILIGLVSNKPWEVLVGQSIARLAVGGGIATEGSLRDFLGARVCQTILRLAD